jgi:hypothetical protein
MQRFSNHIYSSPNVVRSVQGPFLSTAKNSPPSVFGEMAPRCRVANRDRLPERSSRDKCSPSRRGPRPWSGHFGINAARTHVGTRRTPTNYPFSSAVTGLNKP